MNILQLIVQLGVKGTEAVTGALGQVESHAHGAAEGVKKSGHAVHEAEEEFKHFKFPVLEAVVAMQDFTSVAKEAIAVTGELSGLARAMEFKTLQNSLENVTDSAEKARDLMKEIKEIGDHSGFDNADLVRIAPKLVNSGVEPERVPSEIQSLVNLAAMGNMSREQMPDFLEAMVRMKNMDHPVVKQLLGMDSLPLAKLVNAGAGTHFTRQNQAEDYLASTGLGQGAKILEAGADALGKDKAAMQLLQDPALSVAKSMEILADVMEPTGELILKVVTPIVAGLGWLATQLKDLNEATKGMAGLIAIVTLLIRHHRLLFGSIRAAIRYTDELAESIERYGEAARVAAHATGAAEVEGVGVAAAAGAGGAEKAAAETSEVSAAARLAGVAVLAKAAASMKKVHLASEMKDGISIVGWLKRLGPWLKSLGGVARFVKSPTVLSLATSIGGGMLGDHIGGRWGSAVKGASEWGGLGMLGFTKGPWVGLATTLAGVIGGGVYGYRHPDAKDEKSDALEKAADAMNALTFKLVGGGPRTQRSVKTLEVERSLAYALSLGLG